MQIGFIGLGNVGGKLAGSLLRHDTSLHVHDLDATLVAGFVARGAHDGQSPEKLMHACDVVITCLPSPAASADVGPIRFRAVRTCSPTGSPPPMISASRIRAGSDF